MHLGTIDYSDVAGQYQAPFQATLTEKNEASLSGKKVAIVAPFNEGSHVPVGDKGYEGQPLQARKTNRALAALSALALGVASVLYVMPTATSVGAFTAGSIGAAVGALAGPQGLFAGAVAGVTVGSFIGLSVTAYFTPYLMAKVYNAVLDVTNGNGFERSKLADRVVAYYEREASASKAKA
ncbi:hypothetical protein [Endozoicomonas sp. 8E]|uniref:hypothetical protein n=1 Tax=Endozoicomonas sp. 8E TaxID=3035692 RepID=UPI002938D998|nr:hypothetical protein [Endozoicomonas sp. 8E]WOG27488.1 hypothetical protein P6910_23530 [Endozoicomonas sp. 8E]